jgi:dihydrofolate reductase
MRKLIAAINMTIDGYCDHTAAIADEEIHQHYADMLNSADALIYGRTTYELMQSYWPDVVKNPTGEKSTDQFAINIENIPKIVFSRTLDSNSFKAIAWKNARLAERELKEEITELKKQPGKDIFAGSPGLIAALTEIRLVDEYQLCIHPVIVGKGLPLFRNITERIVLKLVKTKSFKGGQIILYYQPAV